MSFAAKIGRAIFWSQAGRLTEAGVLFLFSLLLARLLGPAGYGLYALGLSLASVCAFLTLLGLGPETLGRFVPELAMGESRERVSKLLHALVAVRAAAILLACCAIVLFRHAILGRFHFPIAESSLAAVLLVFAARSMLDLHAYFSSALLETRRVALAKLVAAVVAPAAFVLCLTLSRVSPATAWFSVALGSLAGVLVLRSGHRASPGVPVVAPALSFSATSTCLLRRVLTFGLFAWATNFFIYVLSDSTDVLLLGWLIPDRTVIGYYAVGARIVFSVISLLLGWVSLTSVASMSEAWQSGGAARLAAVAEGQWKLGALCLIAPLSFLLRYAREIVAIFFSHAYAPTAPIMRILCGLMICAVMCGFSIQGGVLYALDHERIACVLVGGSAAFNVITEIIIVRRIGIAGAAWATGLSFVLFALICALAARHYLTLRIPAAFLSKIIAATAAALCPTLWLRPHSWPVLLSILCLYVAAFLAVLAMLKPLSASDSLGLHKVNASLGGWAARFFAAPCVAAGER